MAYRILYVIGNGFDLGLGLKTSYLDFLNWYKKQPQVDPGDGAVKSMRRNICADLRKRNPTWADAEMAFSKQPFSRFDQDVRNSFSGCRHDLTKRLYDYVRRQEEEVFKACDGRRLNCARSWFGHYLFEVFRHEGEMYLPWVVGGSAKPRRVELEFISLNYTRTLEKLLPKSRYELVDGGTKKLYEIVRGVPYHLHGDADPKSGALAAFGVSYADDVKDRALHNLSAEYGYVLKPSMNFTEYAVAKKMISRANSIVLMGTSCGDSDRALWNMILRRMVAHGESVCLYLCCFGKMREGNFLRHADAFGDCRGEVEDRVFETARGMFRAPDGVLRKDDPLRLGWIRRVIKKNSDVELRYPSRRLIQAEFPFV